MTRRNQLQTAEAFHKESLKTFTTRLDYTKGKSNLRRRPLSTVDAVVVHSSEPMTMRHSSLSRYALRGGDLSASVMQSVGVLGGLTAVAISDGCDYLLSTRPYCGAVSRTQRYPIPTTPVGIDSLQMVSNLRHFCSISEKLNNFYSSKHH